MLCGTIGLHERNLVLDATETAEFARSGKAFLDELAAKVRSAPDAYADRHIPMHFPPS